MDFAYKSKLGLKISSNAFLPHDLEYLPHSVRRARVIYYSRLEVFLVQYPEKVGADADRSIGRILILVEQANLDVTIRLCDIDHVAIVLPGILFWHNYLECYARRHGRSVPFLVYTNNLRDISGIDQASVETTKCFSCHRAIFVLDRLLYPAKTAKEINIGTFRSRESIEFRHQSLHGTQF